MSNERNTAEHQANLDFEPDALRVARFRRGLKKSEVAAQAEVSPRRYGLIETGKESPTNREVAVLANALAVPIEFLELEQPEIDTVERGSFRALSRMTASQRDRAHAAALDATRFSQWLETHMTLPQPSLPPRPEGVDEIEGAALALRARWGKGKEPISNLLGLCESRGMRVFALPTQAREVDAFSFWHGETPIVLIDTTKSAERQRFDLAHEIGHLVLHQGRESVRGRDKEREADLFASSFLMPADEVLAHGPRQPSMTDLVRHKKRWLVSAKALNYRLNQLGMMSEWHYRQICIEFSQRWRDREPEPLQRERSKLLTKAEEAWRSEGLRRRDVANQVHLEVDDLSALMSGLTLGVVSDSGLATSLPRTTKPNLQLIHSEN